MTTVQIVGIAIAVIILTVLVVSLVVTHRKDREMDAAERPATPPITSETGAFLDELPRDELELLGESETAAKGTPTDLSSAPAGAVAEAEEAPADSAALERAGVIKERAPVDREWMPVIAEQAPSAEEGSMVGEPSVPAAAEPVPEPEPQLQGSDDGQAAQLAAEGEERYVALSDIIVTTNEQRVDLTDPEVRHMLKELVRDEIDLAIQYRDVGQDVDAVLQLTEAERVCVALGMTSHARLIRDMIRDLQA